jgi:hypothetical protein
MEDHFRTPKNAHRSTLSNKMRYYKPCGQNAYIPRHILGDWASCPILYERLALFVVATPSAWLSQPKG